MHNDLFLALCLALFFAAAIANAEDKGPLVYAPDIVGVDRMFMVALKVATGFRNVLSAP